VRDGLGGESIRCGTGATHVAGPLGEFAFVDHGTGIAAAWAGLNRG